MKHHQHTAHPHRAERTIYYVPRKHLTNPIADVTIVAVLTVILVVAHFMHS